VTPVPAIDVSHTSLDFGSVTTGQTKDLPLTVRNNGTAELAITSGTSSNARFAITQPTSFPINLTAGGTQTATVTLASNNPQKVSLPVLLTGTSPSSQGAPGTITVGQTVTGTLGPVTLRSGSFDPFLQILDTTGKILVVDDNSGGGTDALISAIFTAGALVIEVTTANQGETGAYTLSVTTF